MSTREHLVPFGSGHLTVRDHGGDGPDVLFVHAPGFCAAAFDRVAARLAGRVHAYAIDLPGHGGSTVEMRRPSDAWDAVVEATRRLGLSSTLLVGLGLGSHTCLAASIVAPASFRGVVTFGGACVQSTDRAEDDIAFYTSHDFVESLRTRFFFGARLDGPHEVADLVGLMTTKLATDWRVIGFKGLREEVQYSVRPAPDGEGWINRPTPASLRTMIALQRGDAFYPDMSLYRRVGVPVLIVQLSEGLDQANARQERDLARRNPLVSVCRLDSGEYPHYTRVEEMAQIVLAVSGADTRPAPDSLHA